MKLQRFPHLSQQFKDEVHQGYFDSGDPDFGLELVDRFLEKFPHYPEALLFKARMLIALDRDKEAFQCLGGAQKIDEWRIIYAFDKAEILYKFGRRNEAIKCLEEAIKSLLQEMIEGIENFLIGIDFMGEEREAVFQQVQKEILQYLSQGDIAHFNLSNIKSVMQNHELIEENDKSSEHLDSGF